MYKDDLNSVIFVLGGITSGGAERVASHLIHYWNKKGWKIHLVTGHGPDKDFYHLPGDLNRTIIDNGSPSGNKIIGLMKNVPYVWKLRKALKKIDSKYVISFLTRTNIHTILASAGLNKHVIISERNDTTRESHLWPWPFMRRLFYKYADVVTANSEIALKGMKDYVRKDKLKIVPNPVHVPDKKASPDKSSEILNIGRLVEQKAQDQLLKAIALLKNNELKEWKLNILGEGEEEEKLIKLSGELGLGDTVNFKGLISDPSEFYLNAGIFVLSSLYEGTPNVLLEAMSFGLPCIISDSLPGAMELITNEENGLIFESGNAEDLSEKISILIQNPERRVQMGMRAREKVKEFSLERVIPEWEKMIFND